MRKTKIIHIGENIHKLLHQYCKDGMMKMGLVADRAIEDYILGKSKGLKDQK